MCCDNKNKGEGLETKSMAAKITKLGMGPGIVTHLYS